LNQLVTEIGNAREYVTTSKEREMGYEQIKAGIAEVLSKSNSPENIIEVKDEVVSCEKDHPIVYINVPFGKIMRCPYCNQAYKRVA
tara:strand:+ start:678 stop:935 length:258 start_codon:yes stop_codon:yes gene_type:complete